MQTRDLHAQRDTPLAPHAPEKSIRPLASDAEAEACARIMSTTDPWVTLGRGHDASLAAVRDPTQEAYVATDDAGVAGFVLVMMRGAFVGYIRTVAVREDLRGRGLGSALIAFAERRILRDSPNVFLCVSSFNVRARALYERLGYEVVGELRDYIVQGHSEWLLRKTTGPLTGPRDHALSGPGSGAPGQRDQAR